MVAIAQRQWQNEEWCCIDADEDEKEKSKAKKQTAEFSFYSHNRFEMYGMNEICISGGRWEGGGQKDVLLHRQRLTLWSYH